MIRKLKKPLIYFLAVMLVLPTWLAVGAKTAKKAEASCPAPAISSYTLNNPVISPNADGFKDTATIDVEFNQFVEADIDIINSLGNKVRDLYYNVFVMNPSGKIWDGEDNSDNIVADGAYTVRINYNNFCGSASDTSRTIIVDRAKPITTISRTPDQDLANSYTLIINSNEVGSTKEYSWDQINWSPYAVPVVKNNEGTYYFYARSTDPAGNRSVTAWTILHIDTTAPDRPFVGPVVSPIDADSETISGYAELNSQIKITRGSYSVTAMTDAFGNFSIPVDLLQDQANDFLATAIDLAGNESIATPVTIIEDSTAPTITITRNPDQDSANVSYTVTINYGADSVANIYSLDGGITWSDYTMPFVVSGEGLHTVIAMATDGAGNYRTSTASFTIDTVAPAGPTVSYTVNDKAIKLTWNSVPDAVKYHVYLKNKTNGAIILADISTEVTSPIVEFQTNVASYGEYYAVVTAEDAVGNISSIPVDQTLIKVSAPTAPANTTPVVTTQTPVISVAPETAKAAEVTNPAPTTPTIETPSDDSGKIKSEETTSEEEDINWTPWIVLFVLILLAGAATGGYFYWFAGSEDDEEKPVITETRKPRKKGNAPKPQGRKTKRW